MSEPRVIRAGVREAINQDGDTEWHIECRFSDGQKFAAIIVDGDFPELAEEVAALLNDEIGARAKDGAA